MHIRRRTLRGLFPLSLLLLLFADPALSQNLLVNPGFDRDLSGWTAATTTLPSPGPFPGYVEATLGWTSSDAGANVLSGGVALHAKAGTMSVANASLRQCVPIQERALVSFGAKFQTARQYTTAGASVGVSFFASENCSGTPLSTATIRSLPNVPPLAESNSGGAWLSGAGEAIASATSRSVLFSLAADATGTSFYGVSYVDAFGDDAFLIAATGALTTSLLPSAGWLRGAGGAFWVTSLSLVNPGSADAAVTLKFIPHDGGSPPHEFPFVVRAGQTLTAVETNLRANFDGTYGAILMTSSSPSVFLQSETSTFVSGGGTVGQALPALGAADFAGATPKSLAPIRENPLFRTNLVLANATEVPVTAHVALLAADGTPIGSRDVALPPLGMTQINRVASALGASALDAGRISVSTPTPGGLVAAYASIIDNATNDPRTVLPGNSPSGSSSRNLLANPGFDRDLSGWELRTEFYPPANVDASATWSTTDALGGTSGSVRFRLSGGRQTVNRAQLSQCFAAVPGRRYTGGGMVRTDDQVQSGARVSVELFSSTGCIGDPASTSGAGSLDALGFTGFDHVNSGGRWLPASATVLAGAGVQSVRLTTGIYAVTGSYYSSSSFDGLFDDAYLIEEADPAATSILPAAGRGVGAAGSLWTTTLALANPGPADALVTLKFLFHDADGRSGPEKTVFVRAGSLLEYADVLGTLFVRTQDYGAILVTSSSANLVVQSETSTPSSSGTVGQALPAFGPADFASTTPKALAPIRESPLFRTNLVLANATEIPVTAHVVLYASDGAQIGARDVDLPPLGMTQINRVASAIGAPSLDAGRLSVSTATPGGLVAAYASVIDNVTNDPRTLLPR
jgi:hypothetical protein